MTRKFGNNYKYVKSLYPNAYKLPQEELSNMVNIARWHGNTLEEGQQELNKYIKKNEPMWQQNYFKPQQQTTQSVLNPQKTAVQNAFQPQVNQPSKPYLTFDGQNLSWMDNGIKKKSWQGMSGKPNYQCDYYQNKANGGPIPQGTYLVNQDRLQHFDDLSFTDKAFSYLGKGKWPGANRSWGNHRVWLEPNQNTNTYGRDNFSIHGGAEAGSRGCIDLTDQMDDFTKTFQDYDQDMDLIVNYPQGCWGK